ncbi:EF-hand domain-containing protein [Lysobacter sp. A289]
MKISTISLALVAALAAPLAFAQDATTADPVEGAAATPTQQAAPSEKKSWNDVDTNGDGALSQAEAASVPALDAVFAEADVDADGLLTADEYKAYVAKMQGGAGAGAEAAGDAAATDSGQ